MKGFIINDVCTCGRCGGARTVAGAAVLGAHDEGRADGGAGDVGEVQPLELGSRLRLHHPSINNCYWVSSVREMLT